MASAKEGDVNSDKIYQQAVQKLRMLLSASEVASSMTEEEIENEEDSSLRYRDITPLKIGSIADLNNPRNFLTDPKPRRFAKNSNRVNSKAKRSLFHNEPKKVSEMGLTEKDRHNSWHNLVHLDQEQKQEMELVQKQEKYIAQLEKETVFCREQLSFVLQNVKEVLNEKDAVQKSSEVNTAISQIFHTIKGWQNNIPTSQDPTNQNTYKSDSNYTKKLKESNEVLSKALSEAKVEVEDFRRREEEAVEQVKRSLQAAEQLRMEKTELEYESSQFKLQIERQQIRIRNLIEEQVKKVEEEREVVENRFQGQIQILRNDISKNLEEISSLTLQVEKLQRLNSDANHKLQDREEMAEQLRQDLEKRLGQVQLENVRLNADRQKLEQENEVMRVESEHCRHQLKSVENRFDTESQALRNRLIRCDEQNMKLSKEVLELTEEKSGLERELNQLKNHRNAQIEQNLKNDSSVEQHYRDKILKMEALIKRQSEINTELHRQCHSITSKLEKTARDYENEIESLNSRIEKLKSAKKFERNLELRLEEKGRNFEKMSQRLNEMELNLRKTHNELKESLLFCEELKQEKSLQKDEIEFLKNILKKKGLLPEKESHMKNLSNLVSTPTKKKAVTVKRNGVIH